jgi:heme exporter protein CcmB
MFDQWALRGIAEEAVIAVRLVAHWLSFGPFVMLAALPASALLGIDGATLRTVELGLLAGTPGLAAIGLIIAAVTVSLRGGAALAGLLVIPLAVPLLIFGDAASRSRPSICQSRQDRRRPPAIGDGPGMAHQTSRDEPGSDFACDA